MSEPFPARETNIPRSDVEERTVAPMSMKAAGNDKGETIDCGLARKRLPELSVPLRRVFG